MLSVQDDNTNQNHFIFYEEGKIMKGKMLRTLGTVLSAALILTQMPPLPAQLVSAAGEVTAQDISTCTYTKELNGVTLVQGETYNMTLGDLGVSALETPTEIWLKVTADVSSGLPMMPAIGYTTSSYINADGEEATWYGDGCWIQNPTAVSTVMIPIPAEHPMPDTFQIQLWGETGSTIASAQLNAVGVVTGSGTGADIGIMTRKGDINKDKIVDVKDINALAKYLVGELTELDAPANGDLDGNETLNAKDLTLLKRGILDGTLGGQSPSNPGNPNETAMEFVKHIKVGWNLGNTMDSISDANVAPLSNVLQYETYWQSSMTTQAMIDKIKSAGFNTVRIPVSWGQKMDSNYIINEKWMDRVQEIVDYVINDDMYCILNIHHDNDIRSQGGYFYPDNAHYAQSEKFVTAVWTQVSARFADYDNHLIFETLNEPRLIGHTNEWWIDPNNADCKTAMDCINKLNAAGLKAIRNSGGNNATRFVMMPTYAASPDSANLSGCVFPDDSRLIAEIHAYRPDPFALNGTTSQFDPSTDGRGIITFMNDLENRFIKKGIPVIIDEFGAVNRSNDSERAEWAKFYIKQANSRGIPCVWWDNNYDPDFTLLQRSNNTLVHTSIIDAIMDAAAAREE